MDPATDNSSCLTVTNVEFVPVLLNIGSFSVGDSMSLYSEAEHPPVQWKEKYPLRGSIESYIDPTEPVGEDDWEVLE